MKKRIVAIIVLVVLAASAWLAFRPRDAEAGSLEASGTVEATEADLGFQAPGRVAEVSAREGEPVAAGAVLARLDVAELTARRGAAQAQVEAANAFLRELESGSRPEEVGSGAAAVEAAAQRREEAARVLERSRTLYEGGAISREQYDQAGTALEVAQAQLEQARQQLQLVRSGPRGERIEAQRAAVRAAEAQLAQIDAALESSVVRAPFAGVVTVRHREPGETVAPGAPVVTLMNPGDRWVRIYVREDQVGRVEVGQAAHIRTDSYPDSAFAGRVTFIASEAEFTPRNVQTTEERVKLVYAVKVAVTGDARLALKPGLPADIRLETGR